MAGQVEHPVSESCRVLAEALATECAAQKKDLITFLLMSNDGSPLVVMVATTEEAVANILEWKDDQIESGTMAPSTWSGMPDPW